MREGTREVRLIDALEAIDSRHFDGTVWRVVREERDPCRCNAAGGRWDDTTFDVLYTSLAADGARAEAYFHLRKGLPVFPSRIRHALHELSVTLDKLLDLSVPGALEGIGVDMARYGQLSYDERRAEYPRTQDIAETAHFLGFQGLLVPNARWPCANLVVFCDAVPPKAIDAVANHGLVDWADWQRRATSDGPPHSGAGPT